MTENTGSGFAAADPDQIVQSLAAFTGPSAESPRSGLWALTASGWHRVPAVNTIAHRHPDAEEALCALAVAIDTTCHLPRDTRGAPLTGLRGLGYLRRDHAGDGVVVRTLDLIDRSGHIHTRIRHADAEATSARPSRHRGLRHLLPPWTTWDADVQHAPLGPRGGWWIYDLDKLLTARLIVLDGFADQAGIRCLASAIELVGVLTREPDRAPLDNTTARALDAEASWLRDWVAGGALPAVVARQVAAELGVPLSGDGSLPG